MYKQKYLKYKQKYLKLKAQIGAGNECIVEFNTNRGFEYNTYCVWYNKDTKKFIVSATTQFGDDDELLYAEGNFDYITAPETKEYTKEEFSKVIEDGTYPLSDGTYHLSDENIQTLQKYISNL